jgi:hypothetical protein
MQNPRRSSDACCPSCQFMCLPRRQKCQFQTERSLILS